MVSWENLERKCSLSEREQRDFLGATILYPAALWGIYLTLWNKRILYISIFTKEKNYKLLHIIISVVEVNCTLIPGRWGTKCAQVFLPVHLSCPMLKEKPTNKNGLCTSKKHKNKRPTISSKPVTSLTYDNSLEYKEDPTKSKRLRNLV